MNFIDFQKAVNQCQGCMAGWPFVEKLEGDLWTSSSKIHLVQGGYSGEVCACTKDLYMKGESCEDN